MPDFPTINHVALTVGDLERSVPWYEELFGAKPVLDEDTGPFRHVGGGRRHARRSCRSSAPGRVCEQCQRRDNHWAEDRRVRKWPDLRGGVAREMAPQTVREAYG